MPRPRSEASLLKGLMNIHNKINLALAIFFININVSYANSAQHNQLTEQEKRGGWKLLFNGKEIRGWRLYESATKGIKGWVIDNGTLHKPAKVRAGNIMTANTYENFEFSWEWKLESKGNNIPSRHEIYPEIYTNFSKYNNIKRIFTLAVDKG